MKIIRFVNSVFSSNTYLAHNDREGFIVDPGDIIPVTDFLRKSGLTLKAVLLTHTHYDHIFGLSSIMEIYPEIPVYTSEFGKTALTRPSWNFSRYHDDPINIDSPQIRVVNDGEVINPVEGCSITVMETPGHDMSCLCFRTDGSIFTGDSYIPGVKVVATFPKSDRKMAERWYRELGNISREYQIYPGHGEIKWNP